MAQIGASGQDYLEAILSLSEQTGYTRCIDIAQRLGVSRASVNRAVGVLKQSGLVAQERYSNLCLTPAGKAAAAAVAARHETLKGFLVGVLKVDEETAGADACKMEHAISPQTFEKLQQYMLQFEGKNSKDREEG